MWQVEKRAESSIPKYAYRAFSATVAPLSQDHPSQCNADSSQAGQALADLLQASFRPPPSPSVRSSSPLLHLTEDLLESRVTTTAGPARLPHGRHGPISDGLRRGGAHAHRPGDRDRPPSRLIRASSGPVPRGVGAGGTALGHDSDGPRSGWGKCPPVVHAHRVAAAKLLLVFEKERPADVPIRRHCLRAVPDFQVRGRRGLQPPAARPP